MDQNLDDYGGYLHCFPGKNSGGGGPQVPGQAPRRSQWSRWWAAHTHGMIRLMDTMGVGFDPLNLEPIEIFNAY